MIFNMENTKENKFIFFAQYWGQPYRIYGSDGQLQGFKGKIGISNTFEGDMSAYRPFIELKPLSMITDEEVIEVSMIYKNNVRGGIGRSDNAEKIRAGKELISKIDGSDWYRGWCELDKIIAVIDFLRLKGFAISWMGLPVQALIDYEWIKLKTE